MKKGQVYEGTIESVEFPNKGRIYLPEEDRWVVVKNGVPGQKVRFLSIRSEKERQKASSGSTGTVSQRDSVSLSTFRTVRRLYLSESSV